uniref:Putative secreted protein n=1 Tax=Anopheles darlingi TaxID=43151 RepID=A0A2M4DED6_ANODA
MNLAACWLALMTSIVLQIVFPFQVGHIFDARLLQTIGDRFASINRHRQAAFYRFGGHCLEFGGHANGSKDANECRRTSRSVATEFTTLIIKR